LEPTYEHDPRFDSRHKTVEFAILAHRLCNRGGASKRMERSYEKDLARVETARLKAIEAVKVRAEDRCEPCRFFTGVIAAVLPTPCITRA
jgi:hypothetical protein